MSIPFGAKTWYPLLIFLIVPPCASTARRSSLSSFFIDMRLPVSLAGAIARLCANFEKTDVPTLPEHAALGGNGTAGLGYRGGRAQHASTPRGARAAGPVGRNLRRPMFRLLVLVLVAVPAATAVTDDQRYLRANARLAHATPAYPHARLLVQEPIGGEVGTTRFEAVQRISALGRPATQQRVMRFYARRLGPGWSRRGARRCSGLRGILGDFLGVGYP
jgi:hypothetical protein